ncbi:hypothetical protein BCR34DRAFT_75168 [Clohesyomyces aquaticus]|uniref:Uncharacterized protein n=1 Tax=Clohesyomyces aquaticus TaxID=1231657 RepID=A0A1Y2A3V0_9PLEO|nr:hypothetical protein BCR34DRAFT_75168 [Clohesyomyces aquaticus]
MMEGREKEGGSRRAAAPQKRGQAAPWPSTAALLLASPGIPCHLITAPSPNRSPPIRLDRRTARCPGSGIRMRGRGRANASPSVPRSQQRQISVELVHYLGFLRFEEQL